VESDIRDNPVMSRFEMPLGDSALEVADYKVEDGRVVLLHTEVPQELSGLGYGSRLAHGVFQALRLPSVATRREKSDREVPLYVFLRGPAPQVRRAPRWLAADRRDARAHNAFRRRYPMPIECMSKGNF